MKSISFLIRTITWVNIFHVTLCALMFLSGPLNAYFPTFILPEFILLMVYFYTLFQNKMKIEKQDLACFLMLLFFFLFSTLLNSNGDFFNEHYRVYFFFFFCLFLYSSALDSKKLLVICLFLCKIHILFGIYEIIYINIINPGGYESTFLVGHAMSQYDEDSQYLTGSWDWGFPYIRPFGVLLQPQKSGFIYVMGVILQFLIDTSNHKKLSKIWYSLFLLMAIATAAKTAIMTLLVLGSVIYFDFYPNYIQRPRKTISFYLLLFTSLLYVFIAPIDSDFAVFGDVKNDIMSIFNYGVSGTLMGIGIPDYKDLMSHGFVCECSLARLIVQVGYAGFFFVVWSICRLLDTKIPKINWILFFTFLLMHIHYCILNSHFIILCVSVFVFYVKQNAISFMRLTGRKLL